MKYFVGGKKIMSLKLGFIAKTNSAVFPDKTMHM
jgi:hypothetical protein